MKELLEYILQTVIEPEVAELIGAKPYERTE